MSRLTQHLTFDLNTVSFLLLILLHSAVSVALNISTTECDPNDAGCMRPPAKAPSSTVATPIPSPSPSTTPLSIQTVSCTNDEINRQRCLNGACSVRYHPVVGSRFTYCICKDGYQGRTCHLLAPPIRETGPTIALSGGVIATIVVCSVLVLSVIVFVAYYLKTRYGANTTGDSSPNKTTTAKPNKDASGADNSSPAPKTSPADTEYVNPACLDVEAGAGL